MEFCSQKTQDFATKNNIKWIFGRPYHPQSQGCVERVNGTIKRMLSKEIFANSTVWSDQIEDVVHKYNSRIHSTTGFTPKYAFDSLIAPISQNLDKSLQLHGTINKIAISNQICQNQLLNAKKMMRKNSQKKLY